MTSALASAERNRYHYSTSGLMGVNLNMETPADATGERVEASSPLASLEDQIAPSSPPFTLHPLKEWAMIAVGRQPGIYFRSKTLMQNVDSIPGSGVVKFRTQDQAEAAFSEALDAGSVVRVVVDHRRFPVDSAEGLPGMALENLDESETVHVVIVGRTPGIFTNKASTNANIIHIPGARCQKYDAVDYALARGDFVRAVQAGLVERVVWRISRHSLERSDFGDSFLGDF